MGAIVKPREVDGTTPTQMPPSSLWSLHFAPGAGNVDSQQILAKFFSGLGFQLKRATSPKVTPLGIAHIQ